LKPYVAEDATDLFMSNIPNIIANCSIKNPSQTQSVFDGELWSVHSGGFYHINKLKGPPKKFPKELHWFKWEAYTTWISGFALLIIIYYLNAESMMIDKNLNNINSFTAIVISLSFLAASWLIYDFFCKSNLINNTILFSTVCLIVAIIISYLLTKIYGSRAAYIHVGASLGTIMSN
jgi:uncharacterized membrane protein